MQKNKENKSSKENANLSLTQQINRGFKDKTVLIAILVLIVALIIGGAIMGLGYLDYRSKKERFEMEKETELLRIEQEKESNLIKSRQQRDAELFKLRQINDEKKRQEIEKQKQLVSYYECIVDAGKTYSNRWDSTCKSRGMEADCSLPRDIANDFDDIKEKEKDRCLELFGKSVNQ